MSAREHARLLGLFFYIYAGLNLLGNLVLGAFAALFYFSFSSGNFPPMDLGARRGPDTNLLIGIWALVIGVAMVFNLALVVVKFVGGYALRSERPWAYPAAIAASAVACLGVPVGTVLGVFAFMFIFGEHGKQYFERPAESGA